MCACCAYAHAMHMHIRVHVRMRMRMHMNMHMHMRACMIEKATAILLPPSGNQLMRQAVRLISDGSLKAASVLAEGASLEVVSVAPSASK